MYWDNGIPSKDYSKTTKFGKSELTIEDEFHGSIPFMKMEGSGIVAISTGKEATPTKVNMYGKSFSSILYPLPPPPPPHG